MSIFARSDPHKGLKPFQLAVLSNMLVTYHGLTNSWSLPLPSLNETCKFATHARLPSHPEKTREIRKVFQPTPPKMNMTGWKNNHLKVYLIKSGAFPASHVSFLGGRGTVCFWPGKLAVSREEWRIPIFNLHRIPKASGVWNWVWTLRSCCWTKIAIEHALWEMLSLNWNMTDFNCHVISPDGILLK